MSALSAFTATYSATRRSTPVWDSPHITASRSRQLQVIDAQLHLLEHRSASAPASLRRAARLWRLRRAWDAVMRASHYADEDPRFAAALSVALHRIQEAIRTFPQTN